MKIPVGTRATIFADNVIVAAGTIGSTRLLLKTKSTAPVLDNPRIGEGLIFHPSVPLMGIFEDEINLLLGLDSGTFVDTFGVSPGFILETMSGLPTYGALLIPEMERGSLRYCESSVTAQASESCWWILQPPETE